MAETKITEKPTIGNIKNTDKIIANVDGKVIQVTASGLKKALVGNELEQLAENTDNLSVLTSRVNNITNLPNGSTSADAELSDIRIGANGNTYINAGEAVRQQVGGLTDKLNSCIGSIKEESENVAFDTVTGGLSGNIGTAINIGTQSYWHHTVVNVSSGEKYIVTGNKGDNINAGNYIYFTDNNNIIIDSCVGASAEIVDYSETVVVPYKATKMYFKSQSARRMSCSKVTAISLQSQIDSQQSLINLQKQALPDYYTDDWIDGKINSIRESTRFVNGCAFCFITDLHFNDNSMNSKFLLKKVLDATTVPFALCGGDFPVAYGSKDDVILAGEKLVDYQNYIGNDRFFTIRGNHDFTIKTSSTETTGYTSAIGITYDFLCRNQERWVDNINKNNMCYYLDNKAQKTRIICLNSADNQSNNETTAWGLNYYITQEQVNWLINDALNAEGYKFIFISHIPADNKISFYDKSQEVLHGIFLAIKNKTVFEYTSNHINVSVDFTNTSNEVICHITGHNHKDESNIDDGFLSITTTCDAYYNEDGHGAKAGTLTEQAFDVFCIDYDKRTVKACRVGRGNNREWQY